jgi:long-chain acyl-CoA synthetase
MMERPWHAFWPEGVEKSLEYPEVSVYEMLKNSAKEHPDRPAIVFYGKVWNYRQLKEAADAFAGGLAGIGVKRGDRVSLFMPNVPQYVIAFFGVLRIGAIVVQTNPLYTVRELREQYEDSGTETVVSPDIFYPKVKDALATSPLKRAVFTDIKEYLPFPLSALYPIKKKRDGQAYKIPPGEGVHWFKDLLKGGKSAPEATINPARDVAVLQYTGGTTGTPKAAMLTHRNLVCNAMQTAAWIPDLRPGQERFLSVLPLFHVYGLTTAMLAPVLAGGAMILHPDAREIVTILKLINKQRPTLFPGVPAMYIAINNHPQVKKYDLKSIRACISGSAPLPREVRKQFETLTGGKLVEGYGLSEASPVTHANPLYGHIKEGIGIPFPDTDCRVVDLDTGTKDLPVGEPGEMVVKGPQVMKGYWGKPEETAEVIRDGWLHTGDIATMDEEGYFHIVDRKKDMILVSGYNVYPREVEDVLYEHPAVLEAGVVGVKDPVKGEAVKAYVVLKKGATATAEDLIKHCRENLAAYKVPRLLEFADELPKTMVGKVLRRELREKEAA